LKKEQDDSPHRLVRDLLEQTTFPLVSDPQDRAQNQVMRTVRELEMMGFLRELESEIDFVHLEYDKFQSKVRSRK